MKKYIALSIFWALFSNSLTAQTAPLIISGELQHCAESNLLIGYRLPSGEVLLDTIRVNSDGKFFLQTNKVKEPLLASIQKNSVQFNDLFVAPGYNLHITADVKDFKTLMSTKNITGIGAESNAYRLQIAAIKRNNPSTVDWFRLEKEALILYLNNDYALQDSVAQIMLNKEKTDDVYMAHFYKMIQYDILFQKLYKLLTHVITTGYYHGKEAKDFIWQQFDTTVLHDLYNPKYLISDYYRSWVITNEWPTFLLDVETNNPSQETRTVANKLKTVMDAYPKGAVRDYVLTQMILGAISYSKSTDELNLAQKKFENYLPSISDENATARIKTAFVKKEAELNKVKIGIPAPTFRLQDNLGKQYQLQDFKGKVVYIDVWASWCAPCRAAMPSMKTLHKKYKDDERVVFIGIAVNDAEKNWRKALQKDKPTWLQLYDKNNEVMVAYMVNSIPRYILIDKQGNISQFDAPGPEEKDAIEQLLTRLIEQ